MFFLSWQRESKNKMMNLSTETKLQIILYIRNLVITTQQENRHIDRFGILILFRYQLLNQLEQCLNKTTALMPKYHLIQQTQSHVCSRHHLPGTIMTVETCYLLNQCMLCIPEYTHLFEYPILMTMFN